MGQLQRWAWRSRLALVGAGAVVAIAFAAQASGRTADANCSTETASAAATAAGWDVDPELGRTPINSVICGAFFGAGTQGMAATVAIPTGCGFSIGWGVFRLTNGAWQLVMHQDNGVLKLESVPLPDGGADIRTTQGYPRSTDEHCSPSRLRTRVWHWNGTSFTATAWSVTLLTAGFYSPSHNIACGMFDDSSYRFVYCQSFKPPQTVRMHVAGRLKICRDRTPNTGNECNVGNPGEGTPTLAYGRQITVGRFRCLSRRTGIRCTVIRSGKGFLINRSGVRRVGP